MYKVYLDDELLYSPAMQDLSLLAAEVSSELNATGTFDFTISDRNVRYDDIQKMKSIVRVYDGNTRIFRGRVYKQTRTFYNQKEIICEGELAFLMDSRQRPYVFQGTPQALFEKLITAHNAMVSAEKQFKVGICTVTDPNDYIYRSDSQYLTTWESLNKKLIEPLGGYLWTREEADGVYIDYLAEFDTINPQTVEFAKNLLEFEEVISGKDIATVIIPLGEKLTDEEGNETDERLTIKSVNGGIDYVYDETAVNKFGWIEKVVEWDDVTLPQNLLAKGQAELQNYINLLQSIELTAVDLHAIDRDIKSFQVGSYTRVISEPHGLNELYLTRKRTINLLNQADGVLSLGEENQTLTGEFNEQKKQAEQVAEITYKNQSDFEINKEHVQTQIENLQKTARVVLSTNYGLYQKVLKDGGVDPDYTVSPLVISPTTYFKGEEAEENVSYIWKRKTGTEETDLTEGETVANGILTVSVNMTDDQVRYICYATYTVSETEKYVANAYLDFALLRDGSDGAPGAAGVGYVYDHSEYAISTSATMAPSSGWAPTIPERPEGYLLWMRDVILLSSGTTEIIGERVVTGDPGADGVSITGNKTWFAVSSSATTAPETGWSEDYPSRTAGQYIWQRVEFLYSNGQSDYTLPVVMTGDPGDDGENARTCYVTGKQVMKYAAGAGNPTPAVLKLSASYLNTSHKEWQYLNGDGEWTSWTPAETSLDLELTAVDVCWNGGDSATVRAIDTTETAMDSVSLAKLRDGEGGQDGEDGADAYTVLLGNEAYQFTGDTSHAVAASMSCAVTAYKGTEQVAASIGTITGHPSGMTTTVQNNDSLNAAFKVEVTEELTQQSGVLVVPVTVDGVAFEKRFSWSVSFRGEAGTDGEDAITLHILSSNGNMFKNSLLSTTLTVTIVTGNEMITSSDQMYEKFGTGAAIKWEEKAFGETVFTPLPETDSRISDNGFILTLNPQDVESQAVFNCELDF